MEKEQQAEELLDKTNYISGSEQHILVRLRIRGKLNAKDFNNTLFFRSVKKLISAQWVEKVVVINSNNRMESYYKITRKGQAFNSLMMQHPAYSDIWKMIKHKIDVW
jgi:predicted transcriptional regulator